MNKTNVNVSIPDLPSKKSMVRRKGKSLFNYITKLPEHIRKDDKPRTGIRILLEVYGTRNMMVTNIYKPSDYAQHLGSEKSTRTRIKKHATAQQSENPKKGMFRGSVTYLCADGKTIISCSVSGLNADEDVACAIITIANVVKTTVDDVIQNNRARGGELPRALFLKGHYLRSLLDFNR